MRDAGHRTPDAGHRTSDIGHRTSDNGHRTSDIGHRTAKKAKIIYPPPRGVDIITRSHVAQLVGCWTHNPWVVGSIPSDANYFHVG